MWNDNNLALPDRIASLSREDKQALCEALMSSTADSRRGNRGTIQVLEVPTPDNIVGLLERASPECLETLKRLLGSCNGACAAPSLASDGCYGRRLSKLEEARLRANISGTVDIPPVAGAGGTSGPITVPIYGIEYFLTQFSMDGDIAVATGSVNQVEVTVSHAGFPLAVFRVSQFYKQSCCTTIADAFRDNGICLGWNSTFDLTVVNKNTLAGEIFQHGVFSYTRGYPNPKTGLM